MLENDTENSVGKKKKGRKKCRGGCASIERRRFAQTQP